MDGVYLLAFGDIPEGLFYAVHGSCNPVQVIYAQEEGENYYKQEKYQQSLSQYDVDLVYN